MPICSICRGEEFHDATVLWDGLCDEWRLSPDERAYIDRQQGSHCAFCASNLRSIALARGLLKTLQHAEPLREWIGRPESDLEILEINEAGTLSPYLRKMPKHVLAEYPEVDIHALPYDDGSFDIVIHSDTIEHVPRPIHALAECKRVLRQGGVLAFTVPTVVGRMTQSREGLPLSFHGDPSASVVDYSVYTEYGADMWTHVIRAGFEQVQIFSFEFPSALAMTARA